VPCIGHPLGCHLGNFYKFFRGARRPSALSLLGSVLVLRDPLFCRSRSSGFEQRNDSWRLLQFLSNLHRNCFQSNASNFGTMPIPEDIKAWMNSSRSPYPSPWNSFTFRLSLHILWPGRLFHSFLLRSLADQLYFFNNFTCPFFRPSLQETLRQSFF